MRKVTTTIIMALGMFVTSASAASAATYYVSPTGSDSNPGTDSQPFVTFARAVRMLKPGDTLIAKDGTYTEPLTQSNNDVSKRVVFPSGQPGNPVVIKAQNRHQAIIRPAGGSAVLTIGNTNYSVKHLVIDGLILDGSNLGDQSNVGAGVYISGRETDPNWVSHITFINNEIRNVGRKIDVSRIDFNAQGTRPHQLYKNYYDAWAQGMLVKDSSNHLIAGNYIHHNGVTDFDHGIYQYSENTTMENNIIYNNRGTCIKGGWSSGIGSKSIVRNNLCYNNAQAQFVRGANGSVAGRKSRGLSSHFSNDYEYYNNIVIGKYPVGAIDIIYGPKQLKMYNNFVYNSGGPGIIVGSGAPSPGRWDVVGTQVKNNISYVTDSRFAAIHIASRAKDTVVENNILFGARAQVLIDPSASNTTQRNNISADPKFVSFPTAYTDPQRQINSIAEANALKQALTSGLKVQSSSPAINKGQNLSEVKYDFVYVSRPQGGTSDIGPLEYGGVPTATQTPTPATPRPSNVPFPTSTPSATSHPGGKMGDANNDNRVDDADYTVWLSEFRSKSGFKSDFNRDNKVDGIDLTLWLNNYGK